MCRLEPRRGSGSPRSERGPSFSGEQQKVSPHSASRNRTSPTIQTTAPRRPIQQRQNCPNPPPYRNETRKKEGIDLYARKVAPRG